MIQFEENIAWLLLIVPLILVWVWFQYRWKAPWSKNQNNLLTGIRFGALLVLFLILLTPFLSSKKQFTRKTKFILAIDDSESMISGLNPVDTGELKNQIAIFHDRVTSSNRLASVEYLSGNQGKFDFQKTDINGFIQSIEKKYDPNDVSGVLLVSDGIFNAGLSPDFDLHPFPIHVLATGDTSQATDIKISFLDFNRIAYTGSQFPVNIEYSATGLSGKKATLTIRDEDQKLRIKKEIDLESDFSFGEDLFYLSEDSAGQKKYTINLQVDANESNKRNNTRSIYIDIIDDKKKILLAGLAPHPDMGAIKNAISEREGLESEIWLPSSKEFDLNQEWDMVIFHQIPNFQGVGQEIYQLAYDREIPKFFIWGSAFDIRKLNRDFDGLVRGKIQAQVDEITSVIDPNFKAFTIQEELKGRLDQFPPQVTPFGDYSASSTSNVLLRQMVGRVDSRRPLLFFNTNSSHKIGVFMGNSLWKWRLAEAGLYGDPELTDLLISSSIQYLVIQEEKDRFRFYPSETVVIDGEPVLFRSEYYNEIFEKTYGNRINLKIENQEGKSFEYYFTNENLGTKYQVSGLPVGEYKYTAKTEVNESTFEETGNFIIVKSEMEQINLTANHRILKNLSKRNGGSFFHSFEDPALDSLLSVKSSEIITVRESKTPAINLEWILILIALWLSLEWFLRKRFGGY